MPQEPVDLVGFGDGFFVVVLVLGLGLLVVVLGLGLLTVLEVLAVVGFLVLVRLDFELELVVAAALLGFLVLAGAVLTTAVLDDSDPDGALWSSVPASSCDWPRVRSAAAALAACSLWVSWAARAVATPVAANAPAVRPPVITETIRTVRSLSRGVILFMSARFPSLT